MPACALARLIHPVPEEQAAALAALLDQLLQTVSSADVESGAVLAHARDRLHTLAWNRAAARLHAASRAARLRARHQGRRPRAYSSGGT